MPPLQCLSTNALMASTSLMTGWPVYWLPIGIPRPSRSRGISIRKSRPFCPKRQAEPTSLRRRSRTGKLRRSDDQSIAVGVLVSAEIPVVTSDLPPGASEMKWSPISSTLISGERDAVLVDTAITVDQNQKLVDWIAHSGKNLTAIYATHGHGDHFFGVNTIQKKFPKARFVATSEVIAVMRKQASVPVVESYWKPRFPGQIDSTLLIADELKGGVLELEGKQLISISLGHTDTDSTTCLHVPSIGLAVCGDALYNDVIFIWASRMRKAATSGLRHSIRSSR